MLWLVQLSVVGGVGWFLGCWVSIFGGVGFLFWSVCGFLVLVCDAIVVAISLVVLQSLHYVKMGNPTVIPDKPTPHKIETSQRTIM